MKLRPWIRMRGGDRHYTGLLIVLIFAFFLPDFLKPEVARVGIAILFLNFNILILRKILLSKFNLHSLEAAAIVIFLVDIYIVIKESIYENYFVFFSSFLQSIFIGVSIIVIAQDLFQKSKVTGELLRGSVCVYLMIGFLWTIFYRTLYLVNEEAFSSVTRENFFQKLNYFSFVTLTTVGFGDITPQIPLAMSLANVEAIIGQLFPAIVIARLVGLYEAEKNEE